MFASFSLPAAAVRWRLDVPAGPHADLLLAGLVGAGITVECITPGTAYRLDGPALLLDALAAELAGVEGATLQHEPAPADSIGLYSTVAPSHAFRRTVTIHGQGVHAAGWIVRGVERGLSVASVGMHRWSVSGRTAALVEWLAAVWVKSPDEILAELRITATQAALEDTPTPTIKVDLPTPTVNVNLPDRKVTTLIDRDAEGDIVNVTQTEKTVQ